MVCSKAKEYVSFPGVTMMWSNKLMSNSPQAFFNSSVNIMSELLGVAFPEGWLCVRIIPEARVSIAYFSISLLSADVWVGPPCDIFA